MEVFWGKLNFLLAVLFLGFAVAPIYAIDTWNPREHFNNNQELYTKVILRSMAGCTLAGSVWSVYNDQWIVDPVHLGISVAGFCAFCKVTITFNGFGSSNLHLSGNSNDGAFNASSPKIISLGSDKERILKGSLVTLATLASGVIYEKYHSEVMSNYLSDL